MKLLILGLLLLNANSFAADKMITVLMKTNRGDIHISLNQTKAPITVKNFLSYVDKKYYDGLIFHRVIKQFMIQGGGFDKGLGKKGTGAAIKNEAKNGLSNETGTIAMARTNVVDSATSQFFINVKTNLSLDHVNEQSYGYAVFGRVTKGMPVVKQIEQVATKRAGGHGNVPVEPVIIKSIRRL